MEQAWSSLENLANISKILGDYKKLLDKILKTWRLRVN